MIIRNQFYSDKRRSWRFLQLDPAVAEETLMAVSNPDAVLQLDEVHRAMLELNSAQRDALILVAIQGIAYTQVAKDCDCAEGTIKSRVSRARQVLKAKLTDDTLKGRRGAPGDAMASFMSFA